MPNALLHQGAVIGSVVASTLNEWRGCIVSKVATQPPLAIVLYEMEACPYCRLVREAITALHLDVEIRPCPKGGTRFRPEALRAGGKLQFPLLIDQNTSTTMYESKDIVEYLFRTYGQRSVPRLYRGSLLRPAFGSLASAVRLGHGGRARASTPPAQPLHLWSFEGSPYSRLVRERMSELELPYTLHSLGKEHWKEAGPAARRITPNPYVPREGGKRHAFWQAHGRVQVPYLEDPNTGVALFHSPKIVDYLEQTYAR
ncbi:MAG: glutathione S-transferase [Myxococcaceae bacterium]|nr:glutathione S-transferase [Myxococcaceae bacterium]